MFNFLDQYCKQQVHQLGDAFLGKALDFLKGLGENRARPPLLNCVFEGGEGGYGVVDHVARRTVLT